MISFYLYRLESVKIQPYFFLGVSFEGHLSMNSSMRDIFTLAALPKSAVHGSCIGGFIPANNNRPLEVRGNNRTSEIVTSSEANKNCNLCFPRFPVECIRLYPNVSNVSLQTFQKETNHKPRAWLQNPSKTQHPPPVLLQRVAPPPDLLRGFQGDPEPKLSSWSYAHKYHQMLIYMPKQKRAETEIDLD